MLLINLDYFFQISMIPDPENIDRLGNMGDSITSPTNKMLRIEKL